MQRSEPANVLIVNGTAYLFDAGEGVVHRLANAGIGLEQVRATFISHHHVDHDAGLAPMLMHRWISGRGDRMDLIGPPGTSAMVASIASANRPAELSPVVQDGRRQPPLSTIVQATDLPLDTPQPVEVYRDANLKVLAAVNCHYNFPAGSEASLKSRSYAYRIETAERSYAYTGDTGPCPAIERLAMGVDVLISEVMDPIAMRKIAARREGGKGLIADPDAFMRHMEEDHLTPDEVGQLAARAGAGSVVLTHLVPGFDGEPSNDAYEAGVRAHFSGSVTTARDLDRF
ncbi:MBL fold metallo-hydrolase [Novosphingobium sp. PhB55]|uniref:MBL fold metallo-hydrolase n=1 Tax=Novosphingobium sp. PhB55 TaxID=2485106 RepID=UPI001416F956|nr:MBL fold metallo-hydrolase [Novosphingobium sp. PhB55]